MEMHSRVNEMEELINKIHSVINSRVVIGGSDQIIEIHILANSQRSAKQIIRDIQSALITCFDMAIDHKVISIAQVYDEEESINVPRLTIKSVEFTTEGLEGKAKVILECNGQTYEGQYQGIRTSSQIHKIVAQSTINAVEAFVQGMRRFVVEEVKTVMISGKEVVVSAVTLIQKNSERLLIGKCVVENDVNSAITRSVLDAINRTLEIS
ncbi:hypothetical protein [Alkalibacter mobilis]|uniref:hypothetical protein n=1 Tax=Alkalibacter mobilis TaxID=2787712 RepID=UPI00189FC01F|nr:hypothetical protein [Alkalibacter mobilis]MBF7096590.1 hypothetical protein [Alkalibacter mobilis]